MDQVTVEIPKNVSFEDSVVATANNPTPGFSGAWKDMQKDMDLLAQKSGMEVVPPVTEIQVQEPTTVPVLPTVVPVVPPIIIPPSTEPAVHVNQPTQPPAAVETVPDKFKAPDGSLDHEKLLKSYKEAEKALKRAQNVPQNVPQQVQQQIPVVATPEENTFEAQVYQDFVTSGLDQRAAAALVPTITKLFAAASDAGYSRALSEVSHLKQAHEDTRMRDELGAIVKIDPSLMTPEGIQTLVEIRQSQPWLNQSPEPWKAAWQVKIANESLKRSANGTQVQTPTPKAITVPSAPVTAATIVAETPVVLNDPEAIRNHLRILTDAQKGEFFKRNLGLKTKW